MKKNIWDDVYYRLNDETEIKLSVLFCIRYADIPLSDIEVKHFMLTATSVNFMDLCSAVDSMLNESYIKKVWRDEIEKFDLTEHGKELLDMFENKIMASVRSSIKNTIDEYYAREREKSQYRCEIVPAGKDAYYLDIELKEGKNTLVAMSVFAGSRASAIRLRRGFKNNPMNVYSGIISILTAADNSNEE